MILEQHLTFMEKVIGGYNLLFQLVVVALVLIALLGLLAVRRDLITVLIATELMFLNAIIIILPFCNILNYGSSTISPVVEGELLVLFILVVAAAETAVTFAVLTNFNMFRFVQSEKA